jgi:hypothetical protein
MSQELITLLASFGIDNSDDLNGQKTQTNPVKD